MSLSPLDNRYAAISQPLHHYCTERAFWGYRARVECLYLKRLYRTLGTPLSATQEKALEDFVLTEEHFQRGKAIEVETRHDIKALERMLKEALAPVLGEQISYIHFALTSEDVNNLSYALMLEESRKGVIEPALVGVLRTLQTFADASAESVMLGRTHGQYAVPTTMGKEIYTFLSRLSVLATQAPRIEGKLTGAVGNLNAHHVAYPEHDWVAFSKAFVEEDLGLRSTLVTSQIYHNDTYGQLFDWYASLNQVLIDLCRDVWTYGLMGYLKVLPKGVGSSTMPQKSNPIEFENAEGNLELANALFQFFKQKLTVSRLQRDLSGSTVLRNVGVALGHTLLAMTMIQRGAARIQVRDEVMRADCEAHPEVLAEAVQVLLRKQGDAEGYRKTMEAVRAGYFDAREVLGADFRVDAYTGHAADLIAIARTQVDETCAALNTAQEVRS